MFPPYPKFSPWSKWFGQEDLELLGRIHAAFEYADCQGRWETWGFNHHQGRELDGDSGKLVAGCHLDGKFQIDEFMYVHHSS